MCHRSTRKRTAPDPSATNPDRPMTWETMPLGEFVTLKRGYDLPSSRRTAGSVPVVSSSGITGRHNTAKVKGPGVITGRYGTLGEVFYIADDFWPLNTSLYVQDFKGNDPRFSAYFLQSVLRRANSDKAAVPGVNRNHLHALEVRVTRDVAEQEQIASILAAYDDLIDNNERRIQLLEQSARLLYKEWFGHLRFPGHEHVTIKDGVPDGWAKKPLGEVAATNVRSFKTGGLPNRVNYIDISGVDRGRIVTKKPMLSAEAPGRARRIVRSGDTIWSSVRPNLRAYALVLEPDESDVFSTGFTVLSPTAVPSVFLYLSVTTEEFTGHLVNHTTGASYPAVRPRDFERAIVLLPSKRILEAFQERTEPMYRLVNVLEKEIRFLAQARDRLLPHLLGGHPVDL